MPLGCFLGAALYLGSWLFLRRVITQAPLVREPYPGDCLYECPGCLDVLNDGGECPLELERRASGERAKA